MTTSCSCPLTDIVACILQWAVALLMSLTSNDIPTSYARPDVPYSLTLDIFAETFAVLEQIQVLYKVPLDLFSDWFGCPSVLHDEFFTAMNEAFHGTKDGSGAKDELEHIPERLAS